MLATPLSVTARGREPYASCLVYKRTFHSPFEGFGKSPAEQKNLPSLFSQPAIPETVRKLLRLKDILTTIQDLINALSDDHHHVRLLQEFLHLRLLHERRSPFHQNIN